MKYKEDYCDESSDQDDGIDLLNYKGELYGVEQEKYQDPITGAHFKYSDVYNRLKKLAGKEPKNTKTLTCRFYFK